MALTTGIAVMTEPMASISSRLIDAMSWGRTSTRCSLLTAGRVTGRRSSSRDVI
jgi:hypothetical protein